jgi:hypothetical protein
VRGPFVQPPSSGAAITIIIAADFGAVRGLGPPAASPAGDQCSSIDARSVLAPAVSSR